MRFLVSLLALLLTLCGCEKKEKLSIGLCIVATGKYTAFAEELIQSARQYFFTNQKVTFFVFTDGEMPPNKDVVVIFQKHLGWPDATLKRFHVYEKNRKLLSNMDYLFAIDADMRFVAPVGEEILGRTVAVARDVGKHLTYERNKHSRAYVKKKKAKYYYAGAFYGGKAIDFFNVVYRIKNRIDRDAQWGYTAVWHDESHLNRYFFDHPPQVCLNTAYCYLENWNQLPYKPKIIAIDKRVR